MTNKRRRSQSFCLPDEGLSEAHQNLFICNCQHQRRVKDVKRVTRSKGNLKKALFELRKSEDELEKAWKELRKQLKIETKFFLKIYH